MDVEVRGLSKNAQAAVLALCRHWRYVAPMSDTEPFDAEKVANLTLVQLRRVDERMTTLMEIVLRQDERLGRLERDFGEVRREIGEVRRDIGEIRSEIVLMENRLLNQTQRVISEFLRLEERVFDKTGA